jgi:hypothetical protein
MIHSKKTEHKHLRIDKSSHARNPRKWLEKDMKINHSSQEKGIDAAMNASIQPEIRFSTKSRRKSSL